MGTFFSKKQNYSRVDQSYLLDNLGDIRLDVANKKVITTKDFDHAIRLLEDQIKELNATIKTMNSAHEREISQLRQEHTTSQAAIFNDLRKLLNNDAILDQRIGEMNTRLANLE